MVPNTAEIRRSLQWVRSQIIGGVASPQIDEMALPSYLDGNWVSRKMAWGKLKVVVGLADLQSEDVLLDFGCGTGILLGLIQGKVKKIFATDIILRAAELMVWKLAIPNVEFLSPEGVAALPRGEVTKIVAANVLEHMPDLRHVIKGFADILIPTAKLIVSGPTENFLYRFGRRTVGFSGNYHMHKIGDILAEIASSGQFVLQAQRAFPLPGPFCLYRIASFIRTAA